MKGILLSSPNQLKSIITVPYILSKKRGGGMETDASNLIHSLRIEYSNKLKTNRCGQVVFPLKSIDLNGSNLASKASPV